MARPTHPRLPVNQTLISEVLQRVSNAKTKDEKIKILREYESPALRKVLLCNFSKNVSFVFPNGKTPFNALDVPEGLNHQTLYTEHKIIDRLIKKKINVKGEDVIFYGCSNLPQPRIPQLKKENLWIQFLEELHASEAELMDLVKDKKLTSKYKITRQNVIDAFPDLRLQDE